MNIIAEKIAHKRKELGITQKELAEKLNVSDKTLSRWETGKQIPDALTVLEIARVLNMTINEIYGIKSKEKNTLDAFVKPQGVIDNRRSFADKTTEPQEDIDCRKNSVDKITEIQEDIDYRSIFTYKIILLISSVLFSIGAGIYSHTGTLWNSMKVGAMALSIASLLVFFVSELTFEEFYGRKLQSDIYKKIHTRWFASVVPLIGFFVGIVIPVLKAPTRTLFNSWDAMFPLLLFQGIVLGTYIKKYFREKEERIETAKMAGVYILAVIGILCSIGFIINVLSNPYRLMGGFVHDLQMEIIWKKLKLFEISAGVSFFGMNVLFSIIKSEIFGKVFKRVVKFVGAGIAGIAMVMVVVIGIINHNLQSKVSYVSGEIAIGELVNHGDNILDWIQECNLKGMEINLLSDSIENPETGEMTTRCLIYMPHGYENTEFDVRYQVGFGKKLLKIEVENTTQTADDNFFFGYIEVAEQVEVSEIRTLLDGESVEYGTSNDFFEVGIVLNGKNVVYGRGEEPKVVNIFE